MDTVGGEKLRDFLRIKQDNSTNINTGGGRNDPAGLTLTAVLSDRRLPSAGSEVSSPPRIQSFRTLLDIIQEDQTFNNARMKDNKKSWKGLKGKLRFGRGGSVPGSSWTSSMRMPTSEIPINRSNHINAVNSTSSRMFMLPASAGLPYLDQSTQPDIAAVSDADRDLMSSPRSRPSPSSQRNANRAEGRTSEDTNSLSMPGARVDEGDEASPTEAEQVQGEGESEEEMGNEEGGGEQQPVRMSLMALLAETDREMGLGGSAYSTEEEEDDSGTASAAVAAATTTEYNSCCVCMVRHKGAAFIPCGHTFCRLCCRELLVHRGSCPLCNNYIVEILDIF
ncbi:LON peptidase N-terminal domain and RING finger protein 3-like [Olea europaea var. sylvestris]|uniref:LON peptidase N-terminal domain and RING finger protein 3-like n=1 Tax=Olea europaea var. sylvestris TaxID=158386 RepID=UPI000C1D5084|nr:LON peptidase N-terminal domain and RING finger protein 3-like [Olea europaea var. sylvestris]